LCFDLFVRCHSKSQFFGYGPPNTNREHLRYYTELFQVIKTITDENPFVKSILDVGSGSPPFIRHIDWIYNKTVIAPYFATYRNESNEISGQWNITVIKADFLDKEVKVEADLVLCSQVLEHITEPDFFFEKLYNSTHHFLVISVPYLWPPVVNANHVSNFIDENTLLDWSSNRIPIKSQIVSEGQKNNGQRIIQVFQRSADSYGPPSTTREHLRYYKELYTLIKEISYENPLIESLLDVGSGEPPFIRHIYWIGDKTVIAPYFETYTSASNKSEIERWKEWNITAIKSDFLVDKVQVEADLVLCSQVLEHVDEPQNFFEKLYTSARHFLVISVPYLWPPSPQARHVSNQIDEKRLLGWSSNRIPMKSLIVSEGVTKKGGQKTQRIIQVYQKKSRQVFQERKYRTPKKKPERFRYYKQLFQLIKNVSNENPLIESLLDVGSGKQWPPFIRHIDWIHKKTMIVPSFANFKNSSIQPVDDIWRLWNIIAIKADFLDDKTHFEADLVICSHVLQRAADPQRFFEKLLNSAHYLLVISVPYLRASKPGLHSLSQVITEKTLLNWSSNRAPVTSQIVSAIQSSKPGLQEIIQVFQRNLAPERQNFRFKKFHP